jgi:integrase
LYFILQPSGARSWAVRYRLHGKSRKFTIGDFPTFGLADARAEARKVLQAVTDGRDPTRERKARRQADEAASDTFEAGARRWLEKRAMKRLRAWREPARVLGFTLDGDALAGIKPGSAIDRWRHRPLASITRGDVRALCEDVAERTPVQANRLLAWLSSCFAWHLAQEQIAANPCVGIERQPETSRERTLSDDELKRVWLAAGELETGRFTTAIVRLLILTGMRREEIGCLRWSEIDGDYIRLPADRVKNKRPHDVPLSAPALAILAAVPKANPVWVFNLRGARRISGLTETKARLDELSGVTDWQYHDLRRTVATGLQRLGVRLEVTEAVLNHTSGSRGGIVGVYQRHNWADEKRQALDAWARHVVELVEGRPAAKVVELRPGWAS